MLRGTCGPSPRVLRKPPKTKGRNAYLISKRRRWPQRDHLMKVGTRKAKCGVTRLIGSGSDLKKGGLAGWLRLHAATTRLVACEPFRRGKRAQARVPALLEASAHAVSGFESETALC